MRCPQCRHKAHPRRWWRLPQRLTCYSCGAHLERASRLSFNEAALTYGLVMLPGAMLAWLGGVSGFVMGGLLALLILPVRPWNGLRYELEAGQSAGLPAAMVRKRLKAPRIGPRILGPKEVKEPT